MAPKYLDIKSSGVPQKNLEEVSAALQQGKLAFLVGSGISAERQSCLPVWKPLTEVMLSVVAGESGNKEVNIVKPHLDRMLTEVIFQLMVPEIGQEAAFQPLSTTMSSTDYSAIHKFLAWCIVNYNAVVLTTNYDTLIERAAEGLPRNNLQRYVKPEKYKDWDGTSGALMKLHGTVEDLSAARFAINQVFMHLDPTVENAFGKVLEDRTMIVIGYSGTDEFDINPILFDSRRKHRDIIWLVRKGSKPKSWVQPNLINIKGKLFETDPVPDAFLKEIYHAMNKGKEQQDDELSNWEIAARVPPQEDWWKQRIEDWGKSLRKNNPGGTAFLWARILEYLYLYKEASHAYERSRGLLGTDIKAQEARFRSAWMSRQASQGNKEVIPVLQELQDIAKSIKEQLRDHASPEERIRLQILLGATIHQISSALQALGSFDEAKEAIEEAQDIRRQCGDPELSYSIFQQFINAIRASERREDPKELDRLAPENWRISLLNSLENASSQYKDAGRVADYATTVHNLAFVHQCRAMEFEKQRDSRAEQEFRTAWTLYLDGYHYRNRLYDQRLVAQSEVRLAQCELGLARIALLKNDQFYGRLLDQSAFERAEIVRGIYAKIPQQEYRTYEVEKIEEDATNIIGNFGLKPIFPYVR